MTIETARAVRPASAEELVRALHEADVAGLAVVPRGAGAQQYAGNPPRRVDLVLETAALAGIVEHTPADLTVTVGAGTRFADLQASLARAGQRLALDPPHADAATVGGLIATNASGPRRQRHGTLRDLLIGTRVALVDGTLARAGGKVVKNVAGYDLNKLYIGSLGTLAVIVEATFKVLPLPAVEEAIVATFPTLRAAIQAGIALARTSLRPTALEAHDLEGRPTLVVVAEGERAPVRRVLDDAARVAREHGAGETERRTDVDALLAPSRDLVADPRRIVVRASLPLSAQPVYVEEITRAASDLGQSVAVAAHAGAGIVRAALPPDADAARFALDVAAASKSLDGDAWLERVPESLRAALPDAWLGEPPAFFLMRRVKAEFDPNGTLNPGRFAGGI